VRNVDSKMKGSKLKVGEGKKLRLTGGEREVYILRRSAA
jgi:hypothetical protein